MINLLTETLQILNRHNKTPKGFLWVGDCYKKTTWENFEKIANINYDNSWGCNEICENLLVVGDGWWLERGEYDGSEWWEFKQNPVCESNNFSVLLSVKYDYEHYGDLVWENSNEKEID